MSIRQTNRFWSVSLEHTLFIDFLKLFANMHLVVSFMEKKKRIFWTYGSKVMDVWSFKEKFGQGGHVLEPMRERVDHLCKKWRAGRKKISRKMGTARQAQVSIHGRRATPGRRPALGHRLLGGDHWSPGCWWLAVRAWSPGCDWAPIAGCRLIVGGPGPAGDQRSPAGRRLIPTPIRLFQFIYLFIYLEVWEMGQGFWENGCTAPPLFEACPTLGSANSFKIHGEWRFHFFPRKKIPKFRTPLNLRIYYWDFCSMKKWIH
jgi:hypothetical protein